MMHLVFAGVDPEVMLMSALFDAGLLRFEKRGFGVFFLRWWEDKNGNGEAINEEEVVSKSSRWYEGACL